jgi:hypothetical protein
MSLYSYPRVSERLTCKMYLLTVPLFIPSVTVENMLLIYKILKTRQRDTCEVWRVIDDVYIFVIGIAATRVRIQFKASPRFSTICAKNQVLKLNIDKVTLILATQMPLPGRPPMYSARALQRRLRILKHSKFLKYCVFGILLTLSSSCRHARACARACGGRIVLLHLFIAWFRNIFWRSVLLYHCLTANVSFLFLYISESTSRYGTFVYVIWGRVGENTAGRGSSFHTKLQP